MIAKQHRPARRGRDGLLRASVYFWGRARPLAPCGAVPLVLASLARALRARVGGVVSNGAVVHGELIVTVRDRSRRGPQVLTVALGHRDDLRADGHELSARQLVTPAAISADRER